MRDLRIVFMGTPEFAVSSLARLIEEEYKVVGIITAPDRPAGRGRKLQVSEVKQFALENNLNVLQPTNLKDPEFLQELKDLQANLQVVVAFRMLPESVWRMPEYGTFNLHASLLPQYRGAAPIHWAIINGESKTGVTTFFIDEKIDTGEIIASESIAIEEDETVGILHDKLKTLGADLVMKTVRAIEKGPVTTEKQPKKGQLKSAPKLNRENTKINWTEDVQTIYNKIRGLNPFPAAWTYLSNGEEELSVKIYESQYTKCKHQDGTGLLKIEDSSIHVSAKDGYLIIKEIQLPGKRKMKVRDLLNGYSFHPSAKML